MSIDYDFDFLGVNSSWATRTLASFAKGLDRRISGLVLFMLWWLAAMAGNNVISFQGLKKMPLLDDYIWPNPSINPTLFNSHPLTR